MPDELRRSATSIANTQQHQTYFLHKEKLQIPIAAECQISDAAAIRSARKMARGRKFEERRHLKSISGKIWIGRFATDTLKPQILKQPCLD